MSRLSYDQFDAQGKLVNGYDYDRQCWVLLGIVQPCGHPSLDPCCYACQHAGETL